MRSSKKTKNISYLVNQRNMFGRSGSRRGSKVRPKKEKEVPVAVKSKSRNISKEKQSKLIIEKDQMTVFQSFEQKNISEIDLFESFSNTKTVKTTERVSQIEYPNFSDFRNKSMLCSKVSQIEEGLAVYGKLRKLVRERKLIRPIPQNRELVEFLDSKVEDIQKNVDDQIKVLELVKKHKKNFSSLVSHLREKLGKIEKSFTFFIDEKEDQILRMLKASSLSRNMAMLSAEVFSASSHTIHSDKKGVFSSLLKINPQRISKTTQMLSFWNKQIRKFKKHVNKISDWFFETLSMLSGIPSEKSNTYNPFNIIFSRGTQISGLKHNPRKSSLTRTPSQLHSGLTCWPGRSRKKNLTNCIFKDLRVGTSASYNGRDFSKILPNLKNTSIFQNLKRTNAPTNHYHLPQPTNLIDSRFSSYLADPEKMKKSTSRGLSQTQNQPKDQMQESQIFRHVKFPSARFFYTGKKMNLFLEESIRAEKQKHVREGDCQFKSEKLILKKNGFTGEYLLSKERKKNNQVKSEIISSVNKDNAFV